LKFFVAYSHGNEDYVALEGFHGKMYLHRLTKENLSASCMSKERVGQIQWLLRKRLQEVHPRMGLIAPTQRGLLWVI
jgi:hypothetical protein